MSRLPSVLELVGSFHLGGTEQQAVQLAESVHASGRYRVHVAAIDASGPLRSRVERLGLDEVAEFRLSSFHDRNTLVQARRLARFLRDRRIDVVHTHGYDATIFGTAVAAAAGVTGRVARRGETEGLRSRPQRLAERLAYRFVPVVIANAEAVRRSLVAEGVPERKVEVIYAGLDPARVTPEAGLDRAGMLAAAGLPASPGLRFVSIVANMRSVAKDHPTFLRAARQVAAACPDAAFALAGEGALADGLERLARELGIRDRVHFLGRCERIAEVLAVSEVCVLSSTTEGLSNALLEYLGAGRPVVATDVGGAREAVVDGDNGFLVEKADDAAMASRILDLLADPGRARDMGARGGERVRAFTRETALARTLDLYDRLRGAGGAGS